MSSKPRIRSTEDHGGQVSRRWIVSFAAVAWLVAAALPVLGGAEESFGSLRCVVTLEGTAPKARVVALDDEMRKTMGVDQYAEETFLLGKDSGLANCVIVLRAKLPEQRLAPRPLEMQTLTKVGVRFEPRVLVVTKDTNVVLKNPASPCRGFTSHGATHDAHRFSYMVFEGRQQSVRFTKPDLCTLGCPLRPYARGFVVVVDTPYFAVTDANGEARLEKVPPGEYEACLWHESLDRKQLRTPRATVQVKADEPASLRLTVKPPEDSGE